MTASIHPMTEWCEGCAKRVNARCTVYADPFKKTWHLGCNFSPKAKEEEVERFYKQHPELVRNRVGQQKQAKKKAR